MTGRDESARPSIPVLAGLRQPPRGRRPALVHRPLAQQRRWLLVRPRRGGRGDPPGHHARPGLPRWVAGTVSPRSALGDGTVRGARERATLASNARVTPTGGPMSGIISTRRQVTAPTATTASVTGAMAVGARVLGPSLMGPLALAATAVGAMAV